MRTRASRAAVMMAQLFVPGAFAAYALWMSLAGQPIFKDLLAEPEAAR